MKVYAFTYWADIQCVECTEKFFSKTLDELLDDETIADPEGNTITPLYSWDIDSDHNYCGNCFQGLI